MPMSTVPAIASPTTVLPSGTLLADTDSITSTSLLCKIGELAARTVGPLPQNDDTIAAATNADLFALPRAIALGTIDDILAPMIGKALRRWALQAAPQLIAKAGRGALVVAAHGPLLPTNVTVAQDGKVSFAAGELPMLPQLRVIHLAQSCAALAASAADPIEAAAAVVAGYTAIAPLAGHELDLFFDTMLAAVAQAALAEGTKASGEALAALSAVHPRWARYRLRAAAGLADAVPGAALLKTALANPDLAVAPLVVGSPATLRPSGKASIHTAVTTVPGATVCAVLGGSVHALGSTADGDVVVMAHAIGDVLDARVAAQAQISTFYTVYSGLDAGAAAGLDVGLALVAGTEIGKAAEAGRVWFQLALDLCGNELGFSEPMAAEAAGVFDALTPNGNILLRMGGENENEASSEASASSASSSRAEEDAMVARREAVLAPNFTLLFDKPLHIVRGEGQYLYAADGTQYLDCVNNVCHVGHCHPRVVAAGAAQMAVLNTNSRYLHSNLINYGEKLLAKFPEELCVVFFVNSGSEANDLALRLARVATGGNASVVMEGAYHGHLSSLIELSPYKFDAPGGVGKPQHVHVAPLPHKYRDPAACDGAAVGAKIVADVKAAGQKINAFYCESIIGCGGQIVLPDGYLAGMYDAIRGAGGVTIADEVQTGFGRVGSHFWAFETQGVVPDIVTIGKPMGNGHPVAGVVTTRAVADAFNNGMDYFNTYGGNPVSMAVGLAVLETIEAEGLQANAVVRGDQLMTGLAALKDKYPMVGDVRGIGLFIGVELVTDRESFEADGEAARKVVEHIRHKWHIFVSPDGPGHNVLKVKPPVCVTEADCERVIAAFDDALAALSQ
ncbi:4-aminobutyrate transaminase [Thecamonas trahens ATCC 50062]|uniref:4-aminobutyrate transaminase n=1 Tax=Thecamonas trahens ATCC 50062 TaxID=461836 RepID=A0A0L0D7W3_THETB|nr:4-aminobutyrate transaminase [Thecamonas trahens ATCC 50062]KNC48156.1 4-aminobutyrate transaminase [Thecamonas trahens ATCC 50062]|eukprot:XP_013758726.1 4-aminobutyrate transaminase [Thecamonas trahens ATCC 50062]